MDEIRTGFWFVAISAALLAGCATTASSIEDDFRRCLDQEAMAPSPACWQLFLDRHGDAASAGQRQLAGQYARGGASKKDEVRPRPGANADSVEFPPLQASHDQCYKGFQPSGRARDDLATLAERCGQPAGLVPYSDPQEAEQGPDEGPQSFLVTLRADRCYRVFAAGDRGVQDLDAMVMDDQGEILAFDTFVDPAPILGPQAPFCPRREGVYRLVFSTERGGGRYAFQVWQGDAAAMVAIRAAASTFPQECGQEAATANYGPVQVGLEVVLGKHRLVDGEENWAPEMDAFVGTTSRVSAMTGVDDEGCPMVTVMADDGMYYWRIRDLRPAHELDPNAVTPNPPGGRSAIPRRCGFAPGEELYGPVGLGTAVRLGRHTPVDGDDNWAPDMDALVGSPSKVIRLRGVDAKGCAVVGVELDGDQHAWRVRDLAVLGEMQAWEGETGPPIVEAGQGEVAGLAASIEALPNPTSSEWDGAVMRILVGQYDGDGSAAIDSVAELHAIPCVLWQVIDTGVRKRSAASRLLVTYGFLPDLFYLGNSLGIHESLRELASLRLSGCGLQ